MSRHVPERSGDASGVPIGGGGGRKKGSEKDGKEELNFGVEGWVLPLREGGNRS
jgi:hypothetical protein